MAPTSTTARTTPQTSKKKDKPMNGIAALAAKEVVAASGLGADCCRASRRALSTGSRPGRCCPACASCWSWHRGHGLRRPRLSARGRSLPDPAEAIDITETTAGTLADGPGYAAPLAAGYASDELPALSWLRGDAVRRRPGARRRPGLRPRPRLAVRPRLATPPLSGPRWLPGRQRDDKPAGRRGGRGRGGRQLTDDGGPGSG